MHHSALLMPVHSSTKITVQQSLMLGGRVRNTGIASYTVMYILLYLDRQKHVPGVKFDSNIIVFL